MTKKKQPDYPSTGDIIGWDVVARAFGTNTVLILGEATKYSSKEYPSEREFPALWLTGIYAGEKKPIYLKSKKEDNWHFVARVE